MPYVVVREFRYAKIITDMKGNYYVVWVLTPKQQQHYGKKINPFLCWLQYDLCERHLKRPHLTCILCKLRLVVSKKDPLIYQVIIRQIWIKPSRSQIRRILTKNVLSLAEALG